MEWGGCEQHLCLLAVGLKGPAQRKNMLSPIPKIFRCQEGKEGDPGRAASTWTWPPLHIGEGLSFPKAAKSFPFSWAGDSTASKIEMHDARGVTKKVLAFYFLVIQIN